MTTPGFDGGRGWTLVGKYDVERAGPRYLKNGFGRSLSTGPTASGMQSLGEFGPAGALRWISVDARPLLLSGARYWLHAATSDPGAGLETAWATNIKGDVTSDPVNLFDLTKETEGTCVGNRDAAQATDGGAIVTYRQSGTRWLRSTAGLGEGKCLSVKGGGGHHFCSYDRVGARFSNAGTGSCRTTEKDNIHWAWDDDDTACGALGGGGDLIGTGCAVGHTAAGKKDTDPRSGLPRKRYNYLFAF